MWEQIFISSYSHLCSVRAGSEVRSRTTQLWSSLTLIFRFKKINLLLFFAGKKVVCRRTRCKVLLTWRVDCQSLEWLLMYGHKGSNCSGSQHLKSQGERGERWTEAEQSDDSQYPGEAPHSQHGGPVIPTGVLLPPFSAAPDSCWCSQWRISRF